MRGRWQPYPDEPQVRELTDRLYDLRERAVAAMGAGDYAATQRLLRDLDAIRQRLEEVTAAIVRDNALAPRWVEHTEADAEARAIPCNECGNNISATESRCSYCGWTYLTDMTGNAEPDATAP